MKTLGLDLYNFAVTGDKACNMNANSNMSANHAGPTMLILNDQGGSVMDVSEDVTATLRAQDHGHPPVICFEPGIMSRDCSAGNRAYVDICSTLRAQMGDNQPAICFQQNQIDGVYCALNAGNAIGGQAHGICYAIEGNVVDRVSAKNGKGWCEDVSPTLNTQDRHAVIFEDTSVFNESGKGYWMEGFGCIRAEGENRPSRPGHIVCASFMAGQGSKARSIGYSETISPTIKSTLSGGNTIPSVVISLEGNGARPSHMGKGFSEDGRMYTLNTIEQHSVCYTVDCRNLRTNKEVSGTLQAKDNGGFSYNYLNPVLKENEGTDISC